MGLSESTLKIIMTPFIKCSEGFEDADCESHCCKDFCACKYSSHHQVPQNPGDVCAKDWDQHKYLALYFVWVDFLIRFNGSKK